jgi:AraC-like DNA-binding protein
MSMSGQNGPRNGADESVDPVSGHKESDTPVIGHAASFAPGASVPWHRHGRGQLALTLSRVMRVETPDRVWLVPRGSVLWLPAGTPHRSLAPEQRLMRSLYVREDAPMPLPGTPTAVEQGTPLADMVTWLAETYDTDRLDRAWSTVADAALALVRPGPGVSVRMPHPTDPAVAALADAILADPADPRDLEEWGDALGVSPRTLRRRVQTETGMSYRDWRRYLSLAVAAEKLMAGEAVTEVAYSIGFSSASAFIASFRAAFQVTPGQLRRMGEV